MTIGFWLSKATETLVSAGITSARLDSELLLSHTLKKPRTYLHAHIDEAIDGRQMEIAETRLYLRLDRVPLAYIIGHKEFYGRQFKVTPATLIPRPESEDVIHLLQQLVSTNTSSNVRLVDVGTGSGCLGITAKLEFPALDVTLLDVSTHALNVAKKNAQQHGVDVKMMRSDLLQSYSLKPHIILANLPYVDPTTWKLSPELQHEPDVALYAGDEGLKLIKTLLEQAATRLSPNDHIILEADVRQHDAIISYATALNFNLKATRGLILLFGQ